MIRYTETYNGVDERYNGEFIEVEELLEELTNILDTSQSSEDVIISLEQLIENLK